MAFYQNNSGLFMYIIPNPIDNPVDSKEIVNREGI